MLSTFIENYRPRNPTNKTFILRQILIKYLLGIKPFNYNIILFKL